METDSHQTAKSHQSRDTKSIVLKNVSFTDLIKWTINIAVPILTLVVGGLVTMVFNTDRAVSKHDGDIRLLSERIDSLTFGQNRIEATINRISDKLDRVIEKH